MTASTELVLPLDKKHKLIKSGERCVIQRLQTDGSWDGVGFFQGGSRAVKQWCEANGVYPTRDAEAVLATIPESAFRDRA